MSLIQAIEQIDKATNSRLSAVVRPMPADLAEMLKSIGNVQCEADAFMRQALELTAEQARILITATLHRDMAYSVELLPLAEARSLAKVFIAAAGSEARYFSNCEVIDEVSGVGSWSFMVTTHTFESVLYCIGEAEAALLVAIDED
jgi:hypothetical protein